MERRLTPGATSGKRRRMLAACALSLIALASVALPTVWWSLRGVPSWFRDAHTLQGPEEDARALALEHGVSWALTQPRPGPDTADAAASAQWTVDLKEEDANAWLSRRLPRWLENRDILWPRGCSPPRVRFEPERALLGVLDAGGRLVGCSARVAVEQGVVRLVGPRLCIGRVSLPLRAAAGLADELGLAAKASDLERVQGLLDGSRPLTAAVTLDDGRRVELLHVQLMDGRARLTCRTRTRDESR